MLGVALFFTTVIGLVIGASVAALNNQIVLAALQVVVGAGVFVLVGRQRG